eukprot:2100639-Rhodomonas_salina.1
MVSSAFRMMLGAETEGLLEGGEGGGSEEREGAGGGGGGGEGEGGAVGEGGGEREASGRFRTITPCPSALTNTCALLP